MNEYKNPLYIPRIHDFGDDYHLPDVDEDINQLPMTKVKKIRRRYQNWFDYLEACDLYDNYVSGLKEKYGGDANFKLAMLLGNVREYLPNYPELKKSKRNRYYYKHRIPKVYITDFNFDPVPIEDIESLPKSNVRVKLCKGKTANAMYDSAEAFLRTSISQITSELDSLNAYWIRNNERIERMKCGKTKKKKLKNQLKRKTLRISLQYRSLSDMIALAEKRKRDKFFSVGNTNESLNYYKGRYLTGDDEDQLDLIERLKNLGVVFSKLTKSNTKLIRKKILKKSGKYNSKKKRKRDKKNRKQEQKFLREISGNMYNDWTSFETDMTTMTGSRRFDKY